MAPAKKIAILELGLQSTDFYNRYLRQCLKKRQQNIPVQPVTLLPADFESINPYLPEAYSELLPLFDDLLAALDWTGFSSLLIPNITLHAALDKLKLDEESLGKIVHPVSAVLNKLSKLNISEVTLAATRHTMQSTQLSAYFNKENISVLRPSADDIERIDWIRTEVYRSGYSEALREELGQILSQYINPVLACTELSILNERNDMESNYLDMARLQIQSAIAREYPD